jgi:hypothetical protein
MTAILSWFNQEEGTLPYIITVGDTKISGGEGTLTLEGAKVLELPIKCKDLTTPSQEVYFTSSIGFAFAGSTLVGLNVYCYLQTIFANLGGLKQQNKLPDYKSICSKAKEVLLLYTTSIRSISELLLFGFCPKFKNPFICTIKPKSTANGIDYDIEIKDRFSDEIEVLLIGDKKEDIKQLVDDEISKQTIKHSLNYWRAPAKVLREIIEQNKFETIGGNLQLATVNSFKFDTYSVVVPIKGQEPKATMKFRNFDVFDGIGKPVGECMVSINGMMIEPIKQQAT